MLQLVGGWITYRLVDDGLANLLGLENLGHGTNPINWARIKIFGGLPEYGGMETGSIKNYTNDDTINHFYLFKDSAWKIQELQGVLKFYEPLKNILFAHPVGTKIGPIVHTYMSATNLAARIFNMGNGSLFSVAFGLFCSIFTPTLRFRVSILEIEKNENWKNDDSYCGVAYKIAQFVSPKYIGWAGTLTQGLNGEIFERIKRNPAKFLTGVVQLTIGVSFIVLGITKAIVSPQAAAAITLAGMILY